VEISARVLSLCHQHLLDGDHMIGDYAKFLCGTAGQLI
jgi:hypothetical protein